MTQTYITAEWMNKLWYILVIETIQQWNKWTIASLKNMAKFPRQNKELKTSNTSICCVCVCVCVCVHSVVSDSLWTPWTISYQVPLSMEFSRQEYSSGLPLPPPGDLPWSMNWTRVSCVFCFGKSILYHFATREAPCVDVYSVMSNSLWPHGLQPARLLCARNFPGKNASVVYFHLCMIQKETKVFYYKHFWIEWK